MLFSEILSSIQAPNTRVTMSKDWSQGRASYGGLVAAVVYQAMRHHITDDRPLRSLQITFAGPVAPGDFDLQSEVLREGKSVTHVLGKGIQNGEVAVTVVGSFGFGRESRFSAIPKQKVFEENPKDLARMPYIEGIIPAFTKHFDFRYCTHLPFANGNETSLRGFVKFEQEPDTIDEAHLLGLVDAWPPAMLPLLSVPSPASSLNWTIEFIQPLEKLSGSDYSQYRADIMLAKDGYGHTRASIWNSEGELLALSQQTVVYFTNNEREPGQHVEL